MDIFLDYIKAFAVGGTLCLIGQVLIDKTKFTPGRILVCYVTAGVVLSALGIYGPLVDWAGAGASVPLTGFGHVLAEGVRKEVEKKGFMGNVQRVCCFEGVFLNKLLTLIFVYGTVYCVLSGLFDIINGLPVFPCLETIFVHPLVLRLLLEVAKLLAIGVKALTEINAKLKNETAEPLEFQAAPKAPVASVGGAFCPHCGNAVDAGNAFCAHCGKSIQ